MMVQMDHARERADDTRPKRTQMAAMEISTRSDDSASGIFLARRERETVNLAQATHYT